MKDISQSGFDIVVRHLLEADIITSWAEGTTNRLYEKDLGGVFINLYFKTHIRYKYVVGAEFMGDTEELTDVCVDYEFDFIEVFDNITGDEYELGFFQIKKIKEIIEGKNYEETI